MGDNAAGIPSLLSGRRKTYKPKYGRSQETSTVHLSQSIGVPRSMRGQPYRRAMLCLVGASRLPDGE